MTRSCAKPTCSNQAVSWFDLLREVREVTRSDFATGQGMALCQMHADRFTVPVGWSLKVVGNTVDKSKVAEKPKATKSAKKAKSTKGSTAKTSKSATSKKTKAAKSDKAATAKKPAANKAAEKSKPAKSTVSKAKQSETSKKTKAAKSTDAKADAKAQDAAEPEINPHARETAWFVPDTFEDDEAVSESTPLLGEAAAGSLLDRAFNGPKDGSSGDDETNDELPFPPHGDELPVS